MAPKRLWPQKNKADKKTEAAKMRKGANKKVKRQQKTVKWLLFLDLVMKTVV